MTHIELAEAHRDAIRRHWRGLLDDDGNPPPALLDELAAIATDYAVEDAGPVGAEAARWS